MKNAEFEKIIHQMTENNIPLTFESITTEYRKLLNIYFGESMVIDDELALECLRIPHFYSPFYVYKYATGLSASLSLVKKVIDGDDTAAQNYLEFLKTGGSMFPLDELLLAGVDMKKPEPIEDTIKYFSNLVDKLIDVYK